MRNKLVLGACAALSAAALTVGTAVAEPLELTHIRDYPLSTAGRTECKQDLAEGVNLLIYKSGQCREGAQFWELWAEINN